MPHITIICTANICRSPLAEALLRRRLAHAGYVDWTVSSAGTWAQRGNAAAPFSAELAAEQGLDLSGHRSQIITEEGLAAADLVICMASNHAEALRIEFPDHAHKIYRLSEMVGLRYDIADPYGGPRHEYERMGRDVARLIDEGLPRIVELTLANVKKESNV